MRLSDDRGYEIIQITITDRSPHRWRREKRHGM